MKIKNFRTLLLGAFSLVLASVVLVGCSANGVSQNGKWRTVISAKSDAGVSYTMYDTSKEWGYTNTGSKAGYPSIQLTKINTTKTEGDGKVAVSNYTASNLSFYLEDTVQIAEYKVKQGDTELATGTTLSASSTTLKESVANGGAQIVKATEFVIASVAALDNGTDDIVITGKYKKSQTTDDGIEFTYTYNIGKGKI